MLFFDEDTIGNFLFVLHEKSHGYRPSGDIPFFSPYKDMQDGFATFLDIPLKPCITTMIMILDTVLGFLAALVTLDLSAALNSVIQACIIPLFFIFQATVCTVTAITRTCASIVDLVSGEEQEEGQMYMNGALSYESTV